MVFVSQCEKYHIPCPRNSYLVFVNGRATLGFYNNVSVTINIRELPGMQFMFLGVVWHLSTRIIEQVGISTKPILHQARAIHWATSSRYDSRPVINGR